ncbi:MAG: TonB-dependent receptor plug domain-containing protein [Saprospiraceae bacterium]
MKQLISIFGVLFLVVTSSCNSTKNSVTNRSSSKDAGTIENPDVALTLVDHLRNLPGVMVRGSGENATVTIRGINSINSSTEPLFVLNGQPLSGGLRSAIQAVPVTEIKSIRVLKNAAETGIYGIRGANGVIEITTK